MICAAGNGKGGSWNQKGDILLTTDYNTSIMIVPAAGGGSRPVTDLATDEGFNSHRHPQFLPDGRHFLYFARGNGKVESEIRLATLDGGETTVVMRNLTMGYYASGHLLYVSHGDLVARPMDAGTGELTGAPGPLVRAVMTVPGAAKGAFSVSAEGTLVYLEGETTQESSLTWRDRRGTELEQVGDLAAYDSVALAPDGRRAAVAIITEQAGTWDIWIVDLERNFRTRFTADPADESDLVWRGDSRGLFFTSDRDGGLAVYYKAIGSPDLPLKVFDLITGNRLWGCTADGERFLTVNTHDAKAPAYCNLVLNWPQIRPPR
jgi:Tol biopolymer transport system component